MPIIRGDTKVALLKDVFTQLWVSTSFNEVLVMFYYSYLSGLSLWLSSKYSYFMSINSSDTKVALLKGLFEQLCSFYLSFP